MLFYYLKSQKAVNAKYYEVLDIEAKNLFGDAKSVIKNEADLKKINAIEKQLNLKS